MEWYNYPGCVNCRYIKYLYDNSTTQCVTCRKYNGGDMNMPDRWETVPGSKLDKLNKELANRR